LSLTKSGENAAIQAAMAMQRATVVEMTPRLAMAAAKISLERSLPMADSMILATARHHNATLWTQDADFKDIAGVKYFSKK
jgi:toxin FitB